MSFTYCCVCAPSDDYVIECLLTRRGSKMLGTHQMVDCVNCMFGYCVLIGCLATEGAGNGVIIESRWFGERDWVGNEGSCQV